MSSIEIEISALKTTTYFCAKHPLTKQAVCCSLEGNQRLSFIVIQRERDLVWCLSTREVLNFVAAKHIAKGSGTWSQASLDDPWA